MNLPSREIEVKHKIRYWFTHDDMGNVYFLHVHDSHRSESQNEYRNDNCPEIKETQVYGSEETFYVYGGWLFKSLESVLDYFIREEY